MLNAKQGPGQNASHLLPAELIDKCIGSKVWIIMTGKLYEARSSRIVQKAVSEGQRNLFMNICIS